MSWEVPDHLKIRHTTTMVIWLVTEIGIKSSFTTQSPCRWGCDGQLSATVRATETLTCKWGEPAHFLILRSDVICKTWAPCKVLGRHACSSQSRCLRGLILAPLYIPTLTGAPGTCRLCVASWGIWGLLTPLVLVRAPPALNIGKATPPLLPLKGLGISATLPPPPGVGGIVTLAGSAVHCCVRGVSIA
jgi:hypothetical protein